MMGWNQQVVLNIFCALFSIVVMVGSTATFGQPSIPVPQSTITTSGYPINTLAEGMNRPTMLQEMNCLQLVAVISEDWAATTGVLLAYEWSDGGWKHAGGPIDVTLGRNGLAWGAGLHDKDLNRPPTKAEGDGRSPAGIFMLDSLYGYGDLTAAMDYLKVDDQTYCVDDPESRYYNQIVKGDQVEKDWNSAETMRMESDAYKYGIVVGYNRAPAVPGAGSCIFIHLGKPGGTTAGCTAMAERDILKLIRFLDKAKRPVLVQAPRAEYGILAARYGLPAPPD